MGINTVQNPPGGPGIFPGSATVTKGRVGRNFPSWMTSMSNRRTSMPPPVAPLLPSYALPIGWGPTPPHRNKRLQEVLGTGVTNQSLTGREIMSAPPAKTIPLPKFVSRRPPSISQMSYMHQKGGTPGETTEENTAREEDSSEATSSAIPQEEEKRGRKPRDTDCIGLKSRFSFKEPIAKTAAEYIPQEEVQHKRKEVIQERFHKIVTTTLKKTSSLFRDLKESRHQESGIKKAAKGAPSTGERMLDQWRVWEDFCNSTNTNPGEPELHQLNDFLEDAEIGSIMDRGKKRKRSAIGLLRAVSWMARRAQCPTLMAHLDCQTIKNSLEQTNRNRAQGNHGTSRQSGGGL
jgi:hypothetical protein